MPSIAKSVSGLTLFVVLGLAGIRTGAAAQVVLADPLTAWPLNFGLQSDNIKLKDSAVHIIEPTNTASWATYPGFSFTDMDASLTITAHTATGNSGGLIFWSTAQADFFVITVLDPAGAFAVYRHASPNGGTWQTILPSTASAAVKTGAGAANTLHIVTKGVAVFINDQSLGTLALQSPSGGGTVGIYAEGQAGKPADYAFSNLSVSQ
jgi:hypothetical protein